MRLRRVKVPELDPDVLLIPLECLGHGPCMEGYEETLTTHGQDRHQLHQLQVLQAARDHQEPVCVDSDTDTDPRSNPEDTGLGAESLVTDPVCAKGLTGRTGAPSNDDVVSREDDVDSPVDDVGSLEADVEEGCGLVISAVYGADDCAIIGAVLIPSHHYSDNDGATSGLCPGTCPLPPGNSGAANGAAAAGDDREDLESVYYSCAGSDHEMDDVMDDVNDAVDDVDDITGVVNDVTDDVTHDVTNDVDQATDDVTYVVIAKGNDAGTLNTRPEEQDSNDSPYLPDIGAKDTDNDIINTPELPSPRDYIRGKVNAPPVEGDRDNALPCPVVGECPVEGGRDDAPHLEGDKDEVESVDTRIDSPPKRNFMTSLALCRNVSPVPALRLSPAEPSLREEEGPQSGQPQNSSNPPPPRSLRKTPGRRAAISLAAQESLRVTGKDTGKVTGKDTDKVTDAAAANPKMSGKIKSLVKQRKRLTHKPKKPSPKKLKPKPTIRKTHANQKKNCKNVDIDADGACYPCDLCDKIFKKSFRLVVHRRTHTGEKPHVCRVCQKSFASPGNLDAHLRIHSGERPFLCSVCGKGFREQGARNRHEKIHSTERPYPCRHCSKAFKDIATRGRHERIHTGDKPYRCDLCKAAFVDAGKLAGHMRKHTGERYTCDHCNKEYLFKEHLHRHIKNRH